MNETLILQQFSLAATNKLNFAAVRLPSTTDLHFLFSSKQPLLEKVSLLKNDSVQFVCSPYSAGNLGYTLEAETYWINEKNIFGSPFPNNSANNTAFELKTELTNYIAKKSEYEHFVTQSVIAIQKNKLDKVVGARCESYPLPPHFNMATFFNKLTQAYPHACVYFFHLPNIGTWCGATPEKLLTVEKGVLQTVALAGTLPNGTETNWTDKEYDEQSMTEFFIEETFKQFKLSGVRKTDVESIEAGLLKHLRSTFSWKPKPDVLHQKFSKLLAALNPTPAVCGLPQFDASIFISQNEKLERRFYSGFIGLLKPHETHLYVNLRCMELGVNNVLFYAGAGITEDSNPDLEWAETIAKMETLRSLF